MMNSATHYTYRDSDGAIYSCYGITSPPEGHSVAKSDTPILDRNPDHYNATDPASPTNDLASLLKSQSEIDAIDAAAQQAAAQEEQERQDALDAAVQTLINNSQIIRDSMEGVSQARAALDLVIPIDNTSTATIIDTIAQRQAAVMFLAANSLRAVMHLEKSGDLPDNVVDEFIK